MAVPRVICEKCGSESIALRFKGMLPAKPDDPPAHVMLTIRCPKCGERKQVKPPDNAIGPITSKRAYLSH